MLGSQGRSTHFVAYYRVSTDKQGKSGLGIEAQRQAVLSYVEREGGKLVAEFTEVESGAQKRRPQLTEALSECRRSKRTLIIAKLDRLARNVHVISGLIESGVEFVAADNPHANKLMLHLLAAFAEHEREQIAIRTKLALAAARSRGKKLGRAGCERAEANKKSADNFAIKLLPTVKTIRSRGITSHSGLAAALNASGVPSAKGKYWHAQTASRLVKRIAAVEAPTKL